MTSSVPAASPSRFAGLGVALPTLRDPQHPHTIDAALHTALAGHLAGTAHILLVGGTTGRGSTLAHADRIALLAASRSNAALLCGSSQAATDTELAELAAAGADGLLVAFASGTPLRDVFAYQARLATHGLELVAYHHPSHHDPLPAAWFASLADADVCVKNSDPDRHVLDAMLEANLRVLVGSTARLGDAARAAGVLSGLGSVHLADVAAAYRGDRAAHQRLADFELAVADDRIGSVERLARELAAGL